VEAKDISRAADWFCSLDAAGLWPGAKALLAILGALASKEQGQEAADFYRKLLDAGVQGDAPCFFVIFDRVIPAGDSAAIEVWLTYTSERSLHELGQAYTALLRSKAQTADARQAAGP